MSFHGSIISYIVAVKSVTKKSKDHVLTCLAVHFGVGSVFQQDILDKKLFPLCFSGIN